MTTTDDYQVSLKFRTEIRDVPFLVYIRQEQKALLILGWSPIQSSTLIRLRNTLDLEMLHIVSADAIICENIVLTVLCMFCITSSFIHFFE